MTPLEHYPELAKALGLPDLYFKREDLHKYGSHKGRSIPVMIKHYYALGHRRFAISSSGNAAIAACLYILELNTTNSYESTNKHKDTTNATNNAGLITLEVFVGNNIAPHKLEKLRALEAKSNGQIKILIRERTLQALTQAVEEGAISLRQSTDDIALEGYKELGKELEQVKNLSAVFIGTSSGTTAQALAEHFIEVKKKVQIHIVQTSSCHPIASLLETYSGPSEKSIADAIVSQTTERKDKVAELVKKTGGNAWVATNEDVQSGKELTKTHTDLDISNNSALSVVGAMQASYASWPTEGAVVCLICGE